MIALFFSPQDMVLILDGNSEKGAHVRSHLCYLICLMHLFRSITVINQMFFSEKPIFHHACATCSELPSTIGTMSHDGTFFGTISKHNLPLDQ